VALNDQGPIYLTLNGTRTYGGSGQPMDSDAD
jgi:hypothetical protein